MTTHKEKEADSSSIVSNSPARIEFYDPSKESRWTRLGLNFESFKRAPGVTGFVCDDDENLMKN